MDPYRARPFRPCKPGGTPKYFGGGGGGGNEAPMGLSGVDRVGVRDPMPDLGLVVVLWSGDECAGGAGEPNVSVGGEGVALLQLPTEPASMTGPPSCLRGHLSLAGRCWTVRWNGGRFEQTYTPWTRTHASPRCSE